MRIIAGKFKKAKLISVKSRNTRPTTDFLKEVIFSVLGDCEDKHALDLYAGSGSLGLEALSRGARTAVFVDMSENSIKAIRANLKKLNCEENCRIHKKKVAPYLKFESGNFDLIFIDPPYNKGLINPTVELIFANHLLTENGKIIIERSKKEILTAEWSCYKIFDKDYSDSAVTLLGNKIKE
jgi:16S rRNA (guanine966-N2)-methyltransferase